MGRSGGGSFGGGGFSGGFSGGGRSSGGFSGGGGRSGGPSFGGGRSGGPPGGGHHHHHDDGFGTGFLLGQLLGQARSSAPQPRPQVPYAQPQTSQPVPSPDAPAPASGTGGSGRATGIAIVVFCVLFMLAVLGSLLGVGSPSASTVSREALPEDSAVETAYYDDRDGGWIADSSRMEEGLRYFYRKTGVQPYVVILPNGETTSAQELEQLAFDAYDRLFEDEAHFVLVFCDDGEGSYNCGYAAGSQTKTVMDSEAVGILADCLDRYYNDYSISEEEIFSKAFSDTADRIMATTESPLPLVAVCSAAVVVALVAYAAVRRRQEAKRQERELAERMLNTPLEKFGDQEVEDLAKRYEEAMQSQTGLDRPKER